MNKETTNSKNGHELVSSRPLVLKSLSETLWSARHDAIKALKQHYIQILKSLQNIAEDNEQNTDTINESKNIACKLLELETCILCLFWNDILERINRGNVIFQKERH